MSRILAVEDSLTIRLLLARRLTDAGHRVVLASSVTEAIRQLEDDPPDLILLDLGLPGSGSTEAPGRVRQAAPGVPIVLLSARPDLHRIELPKDVAGRVAKPIDFDHLLTLIEELAGASG